MAKKKLNTHKILHAYHGLSDYGDIAKQAAAWAKANPEATAHDLLTWADATFSAQQPLRMRKQIAPLAIFGDVGTHIPGNAVDQMATVLRLPMATRGAMMPDAHLGYAMPIGGVAGLEGAISPSFVGYDISCMMQLTLLDVEAETFLAERAGFADKLRGVTSFGLGSDFADGRRDHAVMGSPLWKELPILKKLRGTAAKQIGSSGGGNHFADLMLVDFLEPMEGFAAGKTYVGLLTHSGSRGAGHKIATHFVRRAVAETARIARGVPKGYEWLSIDSESGQQYLAAMELMGEYAHANHDLIHDHFLKATGARSLTRLWNRHNYAWVDESTGEVLHRKGATPAAAGQLGIIPGTSGSSSYLVRGLGNAESIESSAHGAGRYFSRSEARRQHDEARFSRHMARQDILHFGLAPDETMFAYKDIEMVIEQQQGVLIEPVARMTPKVVIMGGKSDDGD